MSPELLLEIAVVGLCLAAGGVLKGATGAGAPVLAVPALAAFFDVRFAVVVMLVPNIVTNAWQAWRFRRHLPERAFMGLLLGGGVAGVVLGTLMLKTLPSGFLSVLVAIAVLGYVALRLARPDRYLPLRQARALALPAGALAGLLQGASGLSAPVSITFLNAMQMGRERFIAAIAALFFTFTTIQIIAIHASQLIRPGELIYSACALLPVSLAMPLGAWLARRLSPAALDRVILVLLSGLAAKLMIDALLG